MLKIKRIRYKYLLIAILVWIFCFIVILFKHNDPSSLKDDEILRFYQIKKDYNVKQRISIDDRINSPIIFVVGSPGSGTTLMRTILDVSPDIYCGYETRFIPFVLDVREQYSVQVKPDKEGYSYRELIDNAIRLMIINIIEKGETNKILCVKDPRNVHHIEYLAKLFPNIKVIYMVRDGRGAALSKIRREKKSKLIFYDLVKEWNDANEQAYSECMKIGQEKCLLVKYENLVTQPEPTIRNITKFINVEFIR